MQGGDDHADNQVFVVHPARDRPMAAALAVVTIAAFCWLVAASTQEWWLTGLAVLVLCLALGRFFLPTQYELDDRGVTARHLYGTQRVRWGDVKRVDRAASGMVISELRRRSVRERRRSVHVILTPRSGELAAAIQSRLPAQVAKTR